MTSFIKYPGGKSKEFPLIKKYLPETFDRYFEPFVGGGSVFFMLNVSKGYINDKSEDLYYLYKFVQENDDNFHSFLNDIDKLWKQIEEKEDKQSFEQLGFNFDNYLKYRDSSFARKQKTIQKYENNGVEVSLDDKERTIITARKTALYMIVRDLYNDKTADKIKHTASFYFIREYCYSSMFRFSSKGDFNVPYGGKSYDGKYMTSKIEYMFSPEMIDYLSTTVICNDDFEDFLTKFSLTDADVIFLDPPYDSEFSTYDQNSFGRNEQIRLRNFLARTKAKWQLVIKKTDFIFDLYKDFNIIEYDKNYMVSFKNRNDREVHHLLITNYEVKENE